MSRTITIALIIILAASSVIIVESNSAEVTVPQPSVPQFTVKQVDRSYDVPIEYTTSTDPFTGKQVITSSGGYHVTNKTIDIIIRNQPFSKLDLGNGTTIQLYYSIQMKGHFGGWDNPRASNGYYSNRFLASTSEYTTISLVIGHSDNTSLWAMQI